MALENEIERRLAELRAGLVRVGTVTGTAVGGKVIVTVAGTSMTLSRLKSYTPVTNEPVLILTAMPGAWLVLGSAATT